MSQWVAALASDNPAESFKAHTALKSIGFAAVPALTSAVAREASSMARRGYVEMLGEIGGKGVAATLLKSLKSDPEFMVRTTAAAGLRELAQRGDAEASNTISSLVPSLIDAMGSDDYGQASGLLGDLGPPAKPSLTAAALTHDNWRVRKGALSALGLMVSTDPSGVLGTFLKALNDPDERVRSTAASEMGKGWPPGGSAVATEAVPALIRALNDKDTHVRTEAVVALGKIGAPARSAIPALTAALKDPRKVVRDAAAEALASLTPK